MRPRNGAFNGAWGVWLMIPVGAAGCATTSLSVVAVPVADVRAKPGSHLEAGVHDSLQETQLLYGERVRVRDLREGWALIEAVEQPEYTHHRRWEGYPGWVMQEALRPLPASWRANAIVSARWATVWHDASAGAAMTRLPMGAALPASETGSAMQQVRLVDGSAGWVSPGDLERFTQLDRLPQDQRRRIIVRAAEALLDDAYVWGGRSPHRRAADAGVTGVDCSGLVNLAYRTAGLTIPRDAHEQYLRARPVGRTSNGASKTAVLKPADLVFLSAPDDPRKIVHVMLYAGEGWLVEGPGTGQVIRRISVSERLGVSVDAVTDGARVGEQRVYLGTYLP